MFQQHQKFRQLQFCASILNIQNFTITVLQIFFIIIIIIIIANELSPGGSSPYTSTEEKQIRINIHKRKNTKTQYIQVRIL